MSYVSPEQPTTLKHLKPGMRVWQPWAVSSWLFNEPTELEAECAYTSYEEALTHHWFTQGHVDKAWLKELSAEEFIRGTGARSKGSAAFAALFAPGHALEWLKEHGL